MSTSFISTHIVFKTIMYSTINYYVTSGVFIICCAGSYEQERDVMEDVKYDKCYVIRSLG